MNDGIGEDEVFSRLFAKKEMQIFMPQPCAAAAATPPSASTLHQIAAAASDGRATPSAAHVSGDLQA
ncbi:hypothetical protein GUJ93_ZPchr0001g30063 [Zizania palustris]|uniref:Uncharacterized protein n=1 Tax=Zizania palustris TaxID=103762 RepID=A0A8J5RXV0_ZIZPA|nr:hypothetical protein GUJ93_ZPchr0001g30063 [Zizania palustris]